MNFFQLFHSMPGNKTLFQSDVVNVLSGDLAIFAFVPAVFSKQFAGSLEHAKLDSMQLYHFICMLKSVIAWS